MSDSTQTFDRPLRTPLGWLIKLLLPLTILVAIIDASMGANRVTFEATVTEVREEWVAVRATRSEYDSTLRPEVAGAFMAMQQPKYDSMSSRAKDDALAASMTRALDLDRVSLLRPLPLPELQVGDKIDVSIAKSGQPKPRIDYELPWPLIIIGLVLLMALNVWWTISRNRRRVASNPLATPGSIDAPAGLATPHVTDHRGPFL